MLHTAKTRKSKIPNSRLPCTAEGREQEDARISVLTYRGCPSCGGYRHHTFLTEASARYVLCRCGLVYQNPCPSDESMERHYQNYHPVDPVQIESTRSMMRPVYEAARRCIHQVHPAPGTILDIGCSFGFFLAMMKQSGWSVMGCDPSRPATRHAMDLAEDSVYTALFESLILPAASVDVVTGFYIIEHVARPRDVLRKIYRLLRPGGLVLLRFPYTAPLVRWGKLFGRHDLFHAPWHLTDFTPRHLEAMLAECGFGKVRFRNGGYTRPADAFSRILSRLAAEGCSWLERVHGGRLLPPGLSRNVIAFKP